MTPLDLRTVFLSFILTNIVSLVVVIILWRQTRKRFEGTHFFAIDFVFQVLAILLIFLRGQIPDFLSIVVSNVLAVSGAVLGFIGLEYFTGKKRFQIHNYLIIAVFFFIHAYFTFVKPDLAIRNLNLAVTYFIICSQSVWLVFYRVSKSMRRLSIGLGFVFGGYCIISLIRIAEFFINSHSSNDYFSLKGFETSVIIAYQLLFLFLTFFLALMFNKRLLADIAAQEEKFSKAFHSAPYAITLTRLSDGEIFEANDGFRKITNYSLPEVIGKTTPALNLWRSDTERILFVKELTDKAMPQSGEFQFRKKSGELFTGHISSEIIAINNDSCVVSVINDITNRKLAEEEIKKLNQELELKVLERTEKLQKAYKELESFSYSISHHLRTPLRALDGFSRIILEDYAPSFDAEGRRLFQIIIDNANKMGNLIDELLAFTGIGRMEIACTMIDMHTLANEVYQQCAGKLEKENIEFHLQNIPPASGDLSLMRVVWTNLIGNAVKFSSGKAKRIIEIGTEAESGRTIYYVRDNGAGFNMAYSEKLFAVFQHLHPPNQFEGNGVGLAIVQRIIQKHGGHVWAEGKVDEGAAFYFTINDLNTE